MVTQQYKELLQRLRNKIGEKVNNEQGIRFELPIPEIQWLGRKTIFRNFSEYPPLLRRPSDQILLFLSRELATAASMDGDRAIFIGRKDKLSFSVLLDRYLKNLVLCPVCGSPDTKLEKTKRLIFIMCDACGARSSAKKS